MASIPAVYAPDTSNQHHHNNPKVTMDAQQQHDYEMSQRKMNLKGSKKKLEALLKKKASKAKKTASPQGFDPAETAMRNNPSLTREEVEEMASAFGF